jgi:hypothetical protein
MPIRQRGPKPKEAPEGYARFAAAAKIFTPLDRHVFNYRVKSGDIIVKEDELGKMYEIESVQKVRKMLLDEEKSKKAASAKHYIRWTTPHDVIASMILDRAIYHEEYLADVEHYRERKSKNPYTSIAVFDTEKPDTMYAYISLLPLPEKTIMDILLGKRDETEITSKDILTYDEPGEYMLLASSAAQHPDYKNLLGGLIHQYMEFWINLYPEKRIKCIYAQTVSDDGKRMVNELRMSGMYRTVNEHLERIKDAYVLDMEDPAASRIIRQFQEKLKSKEFQLGSPV